MNCLKCDNPLRLLVSNLSKMYHCKVCHTVEPLSKDGKSLGVYSA
jgi:hypothetical protein